MSTDFWEKLLLQVAGPLIGSIFGTLIFGTFVARITRNAQERRADRQLEDERLREEYQLRIQLISRMTEAASGLYMTSQHYWRQKNDEKVVGKELEQHRQELDRQYRVSRIQGEVIESQLEAFYVSNEPKGLWHAATDLLTVRYFQLIESAGENLLKANAGAEHSGLSVEELKQPRVVLDTYRLKLNQSVQAALRCPMKRMDARTHADGR